MSESKPKSNGENTPKKHRTLKEPWKPGQSGNPSGRPKGSRNKALLALQALLDGEADEIGRKAVEMAKTGDTAAMRLVMERLLPPRKDRPIMFTLPKLETAADAVKATAALVEAVSVGDITPGEASELSKLVDGFTNALKAEDLQKRVEAIEAAIGAAK
jgi:hypothetical protein